MRGSPAFRQLLRYDGVWEDVHERSVLGVAATGDSRIVTASEDRTLKILDAADGSCRSTLTGIRTACGASASCRTAASFPDRATRTLMLWARDGSHLRTLEGHGDFVWCVAALSDDRVASGSVDGTIRIWDVNTGHQLLDDYGNGAVRCLAVLPGGNLIANGPHGELNLWDVRIASYGRSLATTRMMRGTSRQLLLCSKASSWLAVRRALSRSGTRMGTSMRYDPSHERGDTKRLSGPWRACRIKGSWRPDR